MKKIFFLCLISLCALTQTKSQKNDTIPHMSAIKIDSDALRLKSKKQKTAAWIIVGSGLVMEIAGIAIVTNDIGVQIGFANTEPHKKSAAGPIFIIAGIGAMFGSIPLFISSWYNKRKANLFLKNETVLFNPQISMKENFVAAGLKINL